MTAAMFGLVATDSHTEIVLLNIKQTPRKFKDLVTKSLKTMFAEFNSSY